MGKKEIMFLMVCVLVLSLSAGCDYTDPGTTDNEDLGNCADHEDPSDYVWDSFEVVTIILDGSSITVDGNGASVEDSIVTITSAGTYSIRGSLTDGQIIVDTEDEETVRLILDGADISSSTSSPVYVKSAEKTIIVLADGTENHIADGQSYVYEDSDEDEPNAAIFSKSDLTLYGSGSLSVEGNYNDGIVSKDGLIVKSGTITVTAADDAIRGKDYLIVRGGAVTVNAQGDGLKSDNEEDTTRGYVSVEAGTLNITSGGDGISGVTDAIITGGKITITSGGGSSSTVTDDTSAKGIKGVVSVVIEGGTFAIDSADDAIHSNGSITVTGGTFTIATGDDGMHADETLTINEGDITITKSYEGIESAVITINDGDIHIVSSDDGINVAGGNDGSGMGGPVPGQDIFTTSGSYYLYINGGSIVVDAGGDGIDVGGSIEMTAASVIVNGPTSSPNNDGALDYDGSFTISGGFLIAAGSSAMAQAPGTLSTQNSLLLNFSTALAAGTLVHIQTSAGDGILTFAPLKGYQSIAFSSAELIKGYTYDVYYGGSASGTVNDGLYQDGTYTPGTQYTSFTVSSTVTMINTTTNGPQRP